MVNLHWNYFASWISNGYERKYFIENNLDSKKNYRIIMTTIFIVLVAVYIFFKDSYIDLKRKKGFNIFINYCLTINFNKWNNIFICCYSR